MAAPGRGDEPVSPTIDQVRAAVKETAELKARGDRAAFVAKYAEADALQHAAIDGLEKRKQELTRQQQEIEALFKQTPGPEIMITGVVAEVIDLDSALLETARKQARAEAGEGASEEDGPQFKTFTLKTEDLKAFLGTIEKRRHLQILSRPSIVTTDSHVATVSIGETITRAVGVNIKKSGELEAVTEKANIGFTLSVVPSIESETQTSLGLVLLETALSGQNIPLASDTGKGNLIMSPVLQSRRLSTALVSEEGQTLIVALEAPRSADAAEAPKTTLVVLTANQVAELKQETGRPTLLPTPMPPVRQASGQGLRPE
jgi:hypothetical protein